jgi:hypothetical protein
MAACSLPRKRRSLHTTEPSGAFHAPMIARRLTIGRCEVKWCVERTLHYWQFLPMRRSSREPGRTTVLFCNHQNSSLASCHRSNIPSHVSASQCLVKPTFTRETSNCFNAEFPAPRSHVRSSNTLYYKKGIPLQMLTSVIGASSGYGAVADRGGDCVTYPCHRHLLHRSQ